jgi:hypothetical protein
LASALRRRHDRELTDEQLADIVALSGGSPFYITELVRGFLSLEREGRSVTLRSLIEARIQSLDSNARSVLQAATILGKYATIDRIQRVIQLPTFRLGRALTELETEALTSVVEQDVRSRHELISEVCLDITPAGVRALFHRHASTVLEFDAEQRADPALLWQSAQHANTANLQTEARRILERLAEYFLGVGSALEACQAIERALQTCANEPESLRLLDRLISAYRIAGDWQALRRTIDRRRALSERAGLPLSGSARDVFLDYEAQIHLTNDIGSVLPRILEELRNERLPRSQLAALVLLALIVAENSLDADAAHRALALLSTDEESSSGNPSLADVARMIYHTSFGDLQHAAAIARRMRSSYNGNGQSGVVGLQQLRWATVSLTYLGEFAEAEEILSDVAAQAKRQSLYLESYEAAWYLTRLFIRKSNYDKAAESFRDCSGWSARINEPLVQSSVSGLGALLRLAQNQLDEAWRLVRESEDYVAQRPEGRTRSRFLSIKAAIALRREGSIDSQIEADLSALIERSFSLGDVDLGAGTVARAYGLRGEYANRDQWIRAYRLGRRERYPIPSFVREHFLPDFD